LRPEFNVTLTQDTTKKKSKRGDVSSDRVGKRHPLDYRNMFRCEPSTPLIEL
jgi:hypothetical protein